MKSFLAGVTVGAAVVFAMAAVGNKILDKILKEDARYIDEDEIFDEDYYTCDDYESDKTPVYSGEE